MPIVAFYSIKGGVGKTAAAVNLSYLAAQDGYKTLLCDLDAQGSASFYFRIRPVKSFSGKKFIKGGKHAFRGIRGSDFENLDLLAAPLSFRKLDIRLDNQKDSRKQLSEILSPLNSDYQIIFLDAPPNLTLLAENVFEASDLVTVPVIPTPLSELTFEKLMQFVKRKKLPRAKFAAFFSMVEKRKRLHGDLKEKMRASKHTILDAEIPYLADVERMGEHRKPLAGFSRNAKARQAFEDLWQDIKDMLSLY